MINVMGMVNIKRMIVFKGQWKDDRRWGKGKITIKNNTDFRKFQTY